MLGAIRVKVLHVASLLKKLTREDVQTLVGTACLSPGNGPFRKGEGMDQRAEEGLARGWVYLGILP